jgi:hypothetical protein
VLKKLRIWHLEVVRAAQAFQIPDGEFRIPKPNNFNGQNRLTVHPRGRTIEAGHHGGD